MSGAKTESKASAKATAVDDASKVKLLISCLKFASNGTIDWQAVAVDCEIKGTDGQPSKGAAQKRYSRILKAHGVDPADVRKAAATATGGEDATSKADSATIARGKGKNETKNEKKEDTPVEDGHHTSKKRKIAKVNGDDQEEQGGF